MFQKFKNEMWSKDKWLTTLDKKHEPSRKYDNWLKKILKEVNQWQYFDKNQTIDNILKDNCLSKKQSFDNIMTKRW